ncbi:MAG: hypothetical protein HGA45_08800 [Chloroflexales bacterium]|nr:hypothetical protein [Chloroflexales bacterium]
MRRTPLTLLISTLLAMLIALGAAADPMMAQLSIGVVGADGVRAEVSSPAAGLSAAVETAAPRVTASYAKSLRRADLSRLAALSAAAGATAPHVSATYAKSLRSQALSFPKALLNDTTPPRASAPPRVEVRQGQVVIVVEADKFVVVRVRFGSTPGAYPREVQVTLYGRQVKLVLGQLAGSGPLTAQADLTPGTYYYRYSLTDLSGNSAESPEQQFTLTVGSKVFLPSIRR